MHGVQVGERARRAANRAGPPDRAPIGAGVHTSAPASWRGAARPFERE
jgi:hypothetical protein